MYEGILVPVKNCATSELKVLQLCSKRWYFSGLWKKGGSTGIHMYIVISVVKNYERFFKNQYHTLSLYTKLGKYAVSC